MGTQYLSCVANMVLANYDKWRYHPIFRFTGVKDLKHLFPGFGTALCLFAGYLTYKNVIEPSLASHDEHDDHHHGHGHPVLIHGASHARSLRDQAHGHAEHH